MDRLNQVGKEIQKTHKETEQRTRRVSENFPHVERKADHIVYNAPYHMEFDNEGGKSVRLNLIIKPPEDCFQCNPGYSSATALTATAVNGTFPGAGAVPASYTGLSVNSSGFGLSSEGISVPQNGVYTATFAFTLVGVTTSTAAAVVVTVRHNGIIKSQAIWTVQNNKLTPPLGFVSIDTALYGLCLTMREGDTVNGWVEGSGIAFYSPLSPSLTVTRVGLL